MLHTVSRNGSPSTGNVAGLSRASRPSYRWSHLGPVAAATPATSVERPSDQSSCPARPATASASPPAATTSCARPTHFAVDLRDQPVDGPDVAVDADRALAQWETLRRTYLDLGHRVDLIDPVPGLPDMVFAANGATVVDGVVLRRTVPPRRARAPRPPPTATWFRGRGLRAGRRRRRRQRGRGRPARRRRPVILAGHGFRTDPRAHAEAAGAVRPRGRDAASSSTRASTTSTPRSPCSTTTTIASCPRRSRPASQAVLQRLLPGRGRRRRRPTPRCSGSTPCRDGRHVVLPAAGHRARRRSSPSAASTPSRSTCPSCSRAAADRSAARWSCAHDRVTVERSPSRRPPRRRGTRTHGAPLAHNYHPLPVVVADAEGAWVTDVDGRRYLDCLAGYSALNFGHRHPALIAAAHAPARPGDADQPGVPQRPARPVLRRSRRAAAARTWCCR